MKHLLSFLFLCIFNIYGNAHETNEAFFKIIQKESTIEIQAEFPWTMRNALIAFNPSLKNSTNRIDYENTFVKYIKENLILKDKKGRLFEYKEYHELDNNNHSHQNNYLIIFKGNNLFEITNTIMFNIYDNQANYNTIIVNSKKETYITKKGLTVIKLNNNDNTIYWYYLFLIIPLIYLIYRYIKKSIKTKKESNYISN